MSEKIRQFDPNDISLRPPAFVSLGARTIFCLFFASLLILSLSGESRANFVMVFDNNASPNTGYFADAGSSGQRIYDDFTIVGDARISRITWTGVYASRNNVTDDFTVEIYEANGTLPGNLVTQVNVGNVSEQNVGTLLTRDLFEYDAEINELTLTSGATYFISITNDTNAGWAWAADNRGGQIAYSPNAGNNYFNFGSEMEFQLYQTAVPEPNGFTLFTLGLLTCLGRRNRRT